MNVSWNVLNGLIEDLYAQRDAAEADAARLAEALKNYVWDAEPHEDEFTADDCWRMRVARSALADHRERMGDDG